MKIKILYTLILFSLINNSIQQNDSDTTYIVPSAFYFDHDIFMDNQNLSCYFIDFLTFVVYDFNDKNFTLEIVNGNGTDSNLHFCANKNKTSKYGDEDIETMRFFSKYNRNKESHFNESVPNFYYLKKNYHYIYISFETKEKTITIMVINKGDFKLNKETYIDNDADIGQVDYIIKLDKETYGYSFRHHYDVYYLAGFFGYILIFFGLFMIIYGFNHPSVPFLFLPSILMAKIFLIILDLVVINKRVISDPKIKTQDTIFGILFSVFVIIGLVGGILLKNNINYRKIIIGIYFGYILYIIFFYIIMKSINSYNKSGTGFQVITTVVRLVITIVSILLHILFVKPKEGNILPEKFLILAMSIIGSYLFISGITYLGGGISILLEFGVFPSHDNDLKPFKDYAHNVDSVILFVLFLALSIIGFVVMLVRKPKKITTSEGEEISRVLKDSDENKKKFDEDDEDEEGSNGDDE